MNQIQHAAFNGARCSDDFEWLVRVTTRKVSPEGAGEYEFYNRPGHANDNQSGQGTTSMSID